MNTSEEKEALSFVVDDLQNRLQEGDLVTVLDVRAAEVHAAWSIPDSIHVDTDAARKRNEPDALAGVDLPYDRRIVIAFAANEADVAAPNDVLDLEAGAYRPAVS